VVEGGGLENRRRSRVRGFESLPLRQLLRGALGALLAAGPLWIGASRARADEPHHARLEPRLERALADPVAADTELRHQRARGGERPGDLHVIAEPAKGQGAQSLPLAALRALGARVETSRSFARISGPPAVLRRAAALAGIRALRFPAKPVPVDGAGTVLSQAVALTGASLLQGAGVDGTGTSVGVLDLGFETLAAAQSSGNVPASAIQVDLVGAGMETVTPHGTAVAEEVADMAPGAQLYLILFNDEVDFQNGVDYLAAHGIRIANLSVNYFATSYYDDTGPISAIVNQSHDVDGVFWSVGGGNWAFRHWRGPWLDENGDGWVSFTPNTDRLALIAEQPSICIILNWNQYPDQFTTAPTDLDLFVFSASGATVASSQNRQVLGDFPAEQACFTRDSTQEPYSVGVHRFSGGTAGLDLTIASGDAAVSMAQRVTASSMVDPAVAHGAFAVGAIDQSLWTTTKLIENFSSLGPTFDGRIKPDLVAPDSTATQAYGAHSSGTSFAAPVVAGAAALLQQQLPSITANQMRAALVNAAHDVGPVGRDTTFGYGQLVVPTLVLPLDSDGDGTPDATDPCPFSADDICNCGDVDGNGTVALADETALRHFLSDPSFALARPQLCNVTGPAAPFPLDCKIDDWAILRRARAGRPPGIQPVCAPALPR
jgi:subtilase family protein